MSLAEQRKTQTERTIDYLEESIGPVPARELFTRLGINSPRRIITKVRRELPDGKELKKDDRPNEGKKPYKVYWIEGKGDE